MHLLPHSKGSNYILNGIIKVLKYLKILHISSWIHVSFFFFKLMILASGGCFQVRWEYITASSSALLWRTSFPFFLFCISASIKGLWQGMHKNLNDNLELWLMGVGEISPPAIRK